MSSKRESCTDCGSQLESIKLIDATEPGWTREGMTHVELAYAAENAESSFFTSSIPRLGTVRGSICTECGRIFLYGHKN